MDNTLVSARVPKAKKERAASILSSLGSTASDLINSAYDYVIATKELPAARKASRQDDTQSFDDFIASSTLVVDWPDGLVGDYKALEREWRRADYESFA